MISFKSIISVVALALFALIFRLANAAQPDIPQIEAVHNLGVPVGNANSPRHVALNDQTGQLYILSEGSFTDGNTLSVYDINAGQFTDRISLNQGDNEPRDLQFDPGTGLIYALWQERFSDEPPTLSTIDSGSLQVVQNLPDIETMAASEGLLYAAGPGQVATFEVLSNSLTEQNSVPLSPAFNGPMAVDPAVNRLYLARATDGQWRVELFEADTLTPVGSYQAEGPVLNILPLPTTHDAFIVSLLGDFRVLYRISKDGELADFPFELGPRFGAAGIALSPDGERLYYSNGQLQSTDQDVHEATGPALIGLDSASLSPLQTIPLLTNFDDLVISNQFDQAFALYPFNHLFHQVNLEPETVEIVNTAVKIRDLLVDPESGQIFLSDTANRIRLIDPVTFESVAETKIKGNLPDYGFQSTTWGGELALDRGRNRLYVSGLPAVVLEADTLAELSLLEPGGQLAPDSTGNKVYLSNCGVTILDADTLSAGPVIPGSGPRSDGLSPDPCVNYSRLDAENQRLYSLVFNGTPGSNGGNYLYIYDVSLEPGLIYTDTEISLVNIEPAPDRDRAFTGYFRNSNRRLRTLDSPDNGPTAYTNQLFGLLSSIRYSPTSSRLYASDGDQDRLLTLDADTLAVIGETRLPANDFRLMDLDPRNERLYLIGSDGELLVASPGADALAGPDGEAINPNAQSRPPAGKVLALSSTQSGNVVARIEAKVGEFSFEPRLYFSKNGGLTWDDLSQGLPPLPAQAMAVSSDFDTDQTLFAGLLSPGRTGGLYASADGGQSWDNAVTGLQDLWIDTLYIAPNFNENPLLFAKTTYGGLHQSTDGGQNWLPLTGGDPNSPFPAAKSGYAVAFGGDLILASQPSVDPAGGVFRTRLADDGGLSAWERVLDIPVDHLGLSPDGEIALAFGSGLWRSLDGGLSWEAGGAGLSNLDNFQPNQFLFSSDFAQDNTAYLFFNDLTGSVSGQLFRSTDAGLSWQAWVEPPGDQIFTAITQTADGSFLLGNNQAKLTQLSPSEISWQPPETPTDPFPIDDLATSPGFKSDQTLFALSNQHGLFRSGDGGWRWTLTDFPVRGYGFNLNKYQLGISPTFDQDQTLFASTGRSLHRSTDGGQSWVSLTLVDDTASTVGLSLPAQKIAISPNYNQDKTLLVSTPTAVYRSIDGGDSWRRVLSSDGDSSTTDVLALTPDGSRAYARFGYSHTLFTSSDQGQSWQPQESSIDELFSVGSAATSADGGLKAAVEFDKRLLLTDPQTQPWQELSAALPAELSNVTAVVQTADNTLFIGGQGGIFRSSDGGQSWQWAGGKLPADTNIALLRTADDLLFAVTTTGEIYTSPDNGTSWLNSSVVQ